MFMYKPKGVCSQEISFEVIDGKISNLAFVGGCHGNHLGIGRLVEGMDIDKVIERVEGVKCGFRQTSCPDQLAQALKAYKEQNA